MGQSPPQFDRAVVAGVVGPARFEAVNPGLDYLLGRVEVGLPYSEADDVGHRGRDVEEAPDARARDLVDATRQDAGGEWRPFRLGLGVEKGGVCVEPVGLDGRGHRNFLRLGPKPRRMRAHCALSARSGWAWWDRRSAAARGGRGAARVVW